MMAMVACTNLVTRHFVHAIGRARPLSWDQSFRVKGGGRRWSCGMASLRPPPPAATTTASEEEEGGAAAVVEGLSDFLLKGCSGWREAPLCPDYVGPVAVARTADGRGRGLFATEDVRAGSLLVISNAMAISHDDPHRILLLSKLISFAQENHNFMRRIYTLAANHSSQNDMAVPTMDFLTSKTSKEEEEEEDDDVPKLDPRRIMDIMLLNSFEGEFTSRDPVNPKTRFCGLWLIPSLINHSCHRNASRLVVGDAMIIHAAADICAGEEITITYVDVLAPLRLRQEASQAMKFGFSCNCRRCVLEKSIDPLLNDVSHAFCNLHNKATEEVHAAIFSQEPLPLESSFPACMELWNVFDTLHKRICSFDGLSKLEKQWILAGYSSAFLGKWLVTGYSTGFADRSAFVNQTVVEFVEAMKATIPGLLHTLSLITLLVGIAQRMEGNEAAARKLFKLGLGECSCVYGKQKLDVLVKLMKQSTEVIPFF